MIGKLFWAAAFAMAPAALPAAPEVIRNDTLGFEVVRPEGWHHYPVEAVADDLKAAEYADKDLGSALARFATAPVVAFAKFPEPYPDLNPSFKVTVRPAGQLAGSSARDVMEMILPGITKMFADAVVQEGPTVTSLSGLPAAYVSIAYMLRADGVSYPTTSELWIVPRGSYFFLIGTGTRQDEANGTRDEVRKIVNSLRIKPLPSKL